MCVDISTIVNVNTAESVEARQKPPRQKPPRHKPPRHKPSRQKPTKHATKANRN